MSVINTNITSMIGQSNLNKSQNALQTSMERLSSGLRINSAKDDAAGQAIANRMSSQITGLSQAQRNANDGISVAQTAEGALNQVNDNLQRIRELSVQAQNGTNSQDDLNSIQAEIGQRLNEINRISEETDFNGTKVLASTQGLQIQVGANDGETISVNLEEITSSELGVDTFNVNGFDTQTQVISATNSNTEDFTDSESDLTATFDADGMAAPNVITAATSITGSDGTDLTATYTLHKDDSGNLFATDGTDTFAVTKTTATVDGINNAELAVVVDNATSLTAASANPMETLDSALKQVDTLRSDLGAVQNRFESAITNLQTNETNLSAARSRIEDADYASEVANMTRAQILQQAGTSVLAQANQIPQNVLSLLG